MTSPFPLLRRQETRSPRPPRPRLASCRASRLLSRNHQSTAVRSLLSVAAVVALAVLGTTAALTPQAVAAQAPVSSGRVSLFQLLGTDASGGTIGLGMTVDGVAADPATTVVDVPGSASPVTDPALVAAGASTGWTVAPDGPLALGWDASAVAAQPFSYDGAGVSVSWSGPEGAQVFLAQVDPTGQSTGLVPLLYSGSLELAQGTGVDEFPDTLLIGRHRVSGGNEVAPLAGAATWVFTQPGTYTFTATASAARSADASSSNRTEAVTYTIRVGGDGAPQTDPPSAPADTPEPAPSDGEAPPPADTPADTPAADAPTAPSADQPSVPAAPGASATTCEVVGSTESFDTVLDHGHVDMFDLASDSAGNLSLRIKEDVTGHGVLREPGSVLLQVRERYTVPARDGAPAREGQTYTSLPQDLRELIPSLPAAGYVLDANGADQAYVLWPGWDTLETRQGGYESATFEVSYVGPEGGSIHAFAGGTLLGLESVLADGGYALAPSGSVITQPYAAHKHVTWVFSHAGRYVLTVRATATSADGSTTAQTVAHTYTIDVGERSSCLNPVAPTQPSVPAAPAQPPASTTAPVSNAPAPAALAATAELAQSPLHGPAAPSRTGSIGTSGGAGTSGAGASGQCVATTITREATEEETTRLSGASSTGASAAGSGAAANTATTTLTFNVGPGASGNATEGHFDLGPAIENNTLVARIKDDRSQPASWVAPESLTFALGDAAAVQAPAALSFVATEGSTVWMIPSTQIAGVPWLGMNSQREEVVNGTKGGVTFTLDSVSGPGRVAVFNAGALGGGVGTHVFDGAGSAYHLPANTHAHQNWVFTEPGTYTLTISMSVTPTGADLQGSTGASAPAGSGPVGTLTPTGEKGPNGRPMVSEVVGRTPDGKPCDLSLSRTGASAGEPLVAATALVLAGLVLVAARRRQAVSA